jgi:hypothetical protein
MVPLQLFFNDSANIAYMLMRIPFMYPGKSQLSNFTFATFAVVVCSQNISYGILMYGKNQHGKSYINGFNIKTKGLGANGLVLFISTLLPLSHAPKKRIARISVYQGLLPRWFLMENQLDNS